MRRIGGFGAVALLCLAATGASAAGAGGHDRAGINLLRNGNGAVGAYSAQGWDSVTIPGWQIVRGLPTSSGPGRVASRPPAALRRSDRLFAGGPGGTAILSQDVSLRSPRGVLPRAGRVTGCRAGWAALRPAPPR